MDPRILYSIDDSKIKYYLDLESGKKETRNVEPEHEYDLVNLDTHISDGTINKANQSSYDNQFIARFRGSYIPEKIRQYLNHHLKHHLYHSGLPTTYFQKLKDLVTYEYHGLIAHRPQSIEVILRWVEEESTGFAERIYYDTSFTKPESPYQCQIRKQDIKNPEYSFLKIVHNAFSIKYNDPSIFQNFLETEKFFEYHYRWYNYNKSDWLKYTKNIIKQYIPLNGGKYEFYHTQALKWLEDKEQNLTMGSPELNKVLKKDVITERQQGLIIYYLQNHLKKIDRTQNDLQLARFFAFFLNKNPKNIKDWRVYKTILNPLKCIEGKSITALQNDLEVIKKHFQELGQSEIVFQIEKDIEKIHNK